MDAGVCLLSNKQCQGQGLLGFVRFNPRTAKLEQPVQGCVNQKFLMDSDSATAWDQI